MATTNALAFQLALDALRKGLVLQVPAYAGTGTLTAGPNKLATGNGPSYAVHAYLPYGKGFTREEYMPGDAARVLLDYCGRGNLARAARAALEAVQPQAGAA